MQSLSKYKLCKKRIQVNLRILNILKYIHSNKQKVYELERKLEFIEHRINNIEYFMKKIENKQDKKRRTKNKIKQYLILIFSNKTITYIIRAAILIISFLFLLEWADSKGMRNDIIKILIGVVH